MRTVYALLTGVAAALCAAMRGVFSSAVSFVYHLFAKSKEDHPMRKVNALLTVAAHTGWMAAICAAIRGFFSPACSSVRQLLTSLTKEANAMKKAKILCVVSVAFFVAVFLVATMWVTHAEAGWSYQRPITISSTGTALTDYQVKVTLTDFDSTFYDRSAGTEGDDLRFSTDGSGSSEPDVDYWIEEWNEGGTSYVWIEVPSIPASGDTTVYMFYGNAAASAASDGDATFLFFDDFESGNINKWTVGNDAGGDGGIQIESTNPLKGSYSARLFQKQNDTTHIWMYESTDRTDVAIAAKVKIADRVDYGAAGILARSDGKAVSGWGYAANNGYLFVISARYGGRATIWKHSGGSPTELSTQSQTVNLNTEYEIEFRLDGTSLKTYVDGTLNSVTDGSYSTGKIGLYVIESESIFDLTVRSFFRGREELTTGALVQVPHDRWSARPPSTPGYAPAGGTGG